MRTVSRGRPRRLHVIDVFSKVPVTFSLAVREKKGEYESKLTIIVGSNRLEHTFDAEANITALGKKINELMQNRCTVRVYREARAQKIHTLQGVKDFRIDPKNTLRIRPSSAFVSDEPIRFKAFINDDEEKGEFGDDDAIAQAIINADAEAADPNAVPRDEEDSDDEK